MKETGAVEKIRQAYAGHIEGVGTRALKRIST
jgi:hypothetical protein